MQAPALNLSNNVEDLDANLQTMANTHENHVSKKMVPNANGYTVKKSKSFDRRFQTNYIMNIF